MGKIIKNNVVYGGVPDEVITAWETEEVQDLSEPVMGEADISGIGDGSITGAIAEHENEIDVLNTKTTWKYFTSGVGKTTLDISSLSFSEMIVQLDFGGTGNKCLFNIPRIILSNTNNYFRVGGYQNANANQLGVIRATQNQIEMIGAYINGQDLSTTSITQIYYR